VNLGPIVNTSSIDGTQGISPNGLELYFASDRLGRVGGSGWDAFDIWVTKRETIDDEWGIPVNLGSTINSSSLDWGASITADGLELYFESNRPSEFGGGDIYVSTRATIEDGWEQSILLGSPVNTSSSDCDPSISADGLVLFFGSDRPGGGGSWDIWMTRRKTKNDPWGEPVNLGVTVNTPVEERGPSISPDGSTLFFNSDRPGGFGSWSDLWQVSIEPIVDLNADGMVDAADMVIMVDNWGTDNSLCDIGPMPWGDGIVNVEDLIVLAEHLFEEVPPVE
jgi:Tol biopolymer transport system component